MQNLTSSVIMVQRRIGLRLSFTIGEDSLGYVARDSSGERSVSIPYESINTRQFATVKLVATPLFIRLFGFSLILLIIGAAAGSIDSNLGMLLIALALVALFSSLACRFLPGSAFKFRVFQVKPAPPGFDGRAIRVLEGKDADKILAAINAAFKIKMKRLYGTANLENDPVKEINRLTYLKNIDVLTEDEFTLEVSKVEKASTTISSIPRALN